MIQVLGEKMERNRVDEKKDQWRFFMEGGEVAREKGVSRNGEDLHSSEY